MRWLKAVGIGLAIALAVGAMGFFTIKGVTAQPPPPEPVVPGPEAGGPFPPPPGPMPGPSIIGGPRGVARVVMTANDDYLYVLRGHVLLQFDARTLRLVRKVEVRELLPKGVRVPGEEGK
ncbi:MAG TPA: hypothetical protein EYP65_03910 [Armatimonadetes bacterium]|nr:hypothetical protein [Armatimonadota bacterium]